MLALLIRVVIFFCSFYLYFKLAKSRFREFKEDSELFFHSQMNFREYVKKWCVALITISLLSLCSTIFILVYFKVIFLVLLLLALFVLHIINKEDEEYASKQKEATNIVEINVDETLAKLGIKENVDVIVLKNSENSKEYLFLFKLESGVFFDDTSKERFIFSIKKKLRNESIKPYWSDKDGYSKFKFILENSDVDEILLVIAICTNEETYSAFEKYRKMQMDIQKPKTFKDEDF